MRIYLTGFMGAGKSYLGTRLAEALNYPFVDLDARIEALTGLTVTNIFDRHGEATFRDLETQTLRSLLATDLVVATGGGAPCFHGNMEWMNEHGKTVFLDPDAGTLLERLTAGRGHRPLLQSPEQLITLIHSKLSERRPIYELAHLRMGEPHPGRDQVTELTRLLKT